MQIHKRTLQLATRLDFHNRSPCCLNMKCSNIHALKICPVGGCLGLGLQDHTANHHREILLREFAWT